MLDKIKEKLEWIFFILAIIIIFFVGKSCGGPNPDDLITNPVTIIKYQDTIFPKDTIYQDTIIPKYYPKHDTMWLPLPKDSVDCSRVYIYNDTIKKKDYEVYTSTHVQGKLRALDVGVKLKVPLMIKDCTVVKKDSLVYRIPSKEIGIGILASPKMLAPTIEYRNKNVTYLIGYDPFNKYPILGAKVRIWKSKK